MTVYAFYGLPEINKIIKLEQPFQFAFGGLDFAKYKNT